ncbi:hypothetical protein [Geopseudomonas aromaticivorans]
MKRTPSGKFRFYTRCVDQEPGVPDWLKGAAITEMVDDSREISYATLKHHCADLAEIERRLKYTETLTMERDYHVSFGKGKYCGARAYFIVHSSIEHIFVHDDDRPLVAANLSRRLGVSPSSAPSHP